MSHQNWIPYTGSSSIILAVVLFIVTAVLLYLAFRLHHPIRARRPGVFLGVALVVMWLLSVITFLVALTAYVLELYRQIGRFTTPANPITPVTMLSGLVTFFVIAYLTRESGFWVAFGSAIVGTIAAPMIF